VALGLQQVLKPSVRFRLIHTGGKEPLTSARIWFLSWSRPKSRRN